MIVRSIFNLSITFSFNTQSNESPAGESHSLLGQPIKSMLIVITVVNSEEAYCQIRKISKVNNY